MPQLCLTPWFLYFIFSWVILLFLAPNKILKHISLNEPSLKTTETLKFTWTWPWQ
uniref:ATP synthase complex subunit 8 n=1 Tax=Papurana kreffti TaxID=1582975 RepID=A0A0K0LFZ3_9NEOB|nr:ATP synthase F0 subunit 8 [Papurana kreffti]